MLSATPIDLFASSLALLFWLKKLLISRFIIGSLRSLGRSHLDAFPSSIIVLNLSSDGIFAIFSSHRACDLIDSDGLMSELIDDDDVSELVE
jgi:hypothetical protein